jgi:hypothetical protein
MLDTRAATPTETEGTARDVNGLHTLTRIAIAAVLLSAGYARAQFGRWNCASLEDNAATPSEFAVARWRFGTNGRIRNCGWSHNYPESEINLNEFIGRTTRIDVQYASYRLLKLGSDAIYDYPFAYVSEPGEMEMTEGEVAHMREYIDRGGFILIDDFDGDHLDNLREELSRVFPNRHFERLAVEHPIFDLVFKVDDLRSMAPYVAGGEPAYYAFMNDQGEIAIVACHNNDLANFWEWYGSPQYPLKPATDAFRMGADFVVHALTH